MKLILLIISFWLISLSAKSQLYFPPNNSNLWETISPEKLGWCENKIDSLYNLLNSNNTKAFILLKDGKIVLENYFNGFSSSSNWYWASAGKSLTAILIGIAQQEKFLSITDTTSKYLGLGWSGCTTAQENKITIFHQLTMTSGLDDGLSDPYCTTDTCLQYLADAGTRWAYHNGPYTLLDKVIENATGQTINAFYSSQLKNSTGMDGLYIKQGYNNVFYSTARSMARFGLLVSNHGNWNGNQILTETAFFNQMVNTSQNYNESYGYLWWLNGKNSYMVPQSQRMFSGSVNPNAPKDMIAALGKNGQFINIVPSQNIVWIRMGDSPDNSLVPFMFNDKIWEYINNLGCSAVEVSHLKAFKPVFSIYPNPVHDVAHIQYKGILESYTTCSIYNTLGNEIYCELITNNPKDIFMGFLKKGMYFFVFNNGLGHQSFKVIKE